MRQKQTYVRGAALLFVALLLSTLAPPLAGAVDSGTPNPTGAFNLVVSPPSVGIEAKPGSSVTTEIRVQNQGLANEPVKVSLMKFGAQGQDGTPQLEELTPDDQFAKWARFSTTSFIAEPNVWKSVKLTIAPPKDAAFGYYYAVIFSREGAEKQIKQEQANLLGAIASLVLVDVPAPGAIKKAEIAEFSTGNKVQEFLPTNFTVRMQNNGNTHVAPRGNIMISKGGKTVGLLEVNLKKGYILPDSFRKFNSEWTDGTPYYATQTADGKTVLGENGKPKQSLVWDKFSLSKLRFGKYTAKLVMVYDDGKGDVATESTLSFWVIPWRIIGGFAVVGLFVLAGLWATILRPAYKRFKKNRRNAQPR